MCKEDAAKTSLANDSSLKDNSLSPDPAILNDPRYMTWHDRIQRYCDRNNLTEQDNEFFSGLLTEVILDCCADPKSSVWATLTSTCQFCGQNVKRVCTAFPITQDTASASALSRDAPDESSVQHETKPKDGWVTFGRIKTDIENETETFERIYPPESTSVSSSEIARAVDCVCGDNGNDHRTEEGTGAARECTKCGCAGFYNVHMALEAATVQLSQLQQERGRLQQLWDLDRTAARVFQQERDALKEKVERVESEYASVLEVTARLNIEKHQAASRIRAALIERVREVSEGFTDSVAAERFTTRIIAELEKIEVK